MELRRQEESVVFVAFGVENAKPGSLVVKEGEYIEGTVLNITESKMYGHVYKLQVAGQKDPVVITGKTALNDGMGYGSKKTIAPVTENSFVRITYLGKYQTNKGKSGYKFLVEVGV